MHTDRENEGKLSKPESEFDKFVYAVSHDLQEPLRGISAFLKLLDQKYSDELDDQAQTYINFTLENADRMRQMIHALVDLSRVSRNRDPIEEIDLNEVASEIWSMYQSDPAAISNAAFISEDLPNIQGTTSQMIQLLQILFQNSLDNRKKEDLTIRLHVKDEGDHFIFSFSDNGRGIPEGYIDSVFEIFRKVDPNNDRAGAGLAIAKSIVEKHGGNISVTSRSGEGTTVYFTWPKGS